ncbi:MAG TPA: hypothetical protein VIK18_19990 [Pirellulales bacterium]
MLTASDFQRAAEQRFTTTEFLLERSYPLDAFYLAGYSVECMLKALVMHRTLAAGHAATFQRLKSGASMHYPERLNQELKGLGYPMPLDLVKRFRRFSWSTELRYAPGRWPPSEVLGYLRAAKQAIDWVNGEIA